MKTTEAGTQQVTRYPLALVVDFWVGVAAILAMLFCAFAQYLRNPTPSLSFLLSHHIQDLLVLGVVFWAASWIVLRIALVTPLKRVFAHLYASLSP